METKKTAVQWLIEQVNSDQYKHAFGSTYLSVALIEEAEAMDKVQIIEAFNEGALDGLQLGEQFYNFVYGN